MKEDTRSLDQGSYYGAYWGVYREFFEKHPSRLGFKLPTAAQKKQ